MSSKIPNNLNCFNELSLLFEYSYKVYKEYIKSEKQFLYAKILFGVNQKIYKKLILNSSKFDHAIDNDVISLLIHLDVWRTIWMDEFEAQNPKLKDTFTFSNDVRFPKESADRLLSSLKN